MNTGRYLNLDVSDRGAWRRVTCFHRDVLSIDALQQASHALLQLSAHPGLRARLIESGETAPVAIWAADTGWRPYRCASEVAQQVEATT
ncbi:MAG: hypothetical protein MUF08_03130 [Burkholderiaceae bacterium]|jgi:hypothetical protein|nr:hypothetical protein [Burkholderiaceae bacterium]MCU0964056.1 hypothetical protein [Burkholderiaceae bacterium]